MLQMFCFFLTFTNSKNISDCQNTKHSTMSFIDDVWQQIKRVQTTFDSWVSKNVSRESQNVIIIFVVLMMVLHLVYTKRKLTREYKAEQEQAKKKDQ